jgi:Trypsin-co-occurring domain 1
MSSQVVTYALDDSTTVSFEVEPAPGFRPAGAGEVIGRVQSAVGPAVEAAKLVLDRVREVRPDQVELKFGIKVSGNANWLVARAATEGNFEITLTWARDRAGGQQADGQQSAAGVGEDGT